MGQFLEKYAKVPASQRYIVLAVIVLGLLSAHYFLVYDGQLEEIGKVEKDLKKAVELVDEKSSVADNVERYEQRLARLQMELDEAKAMLPDAADEAQLLAQLGNEARQSGLLISSFRPQGEDVADFYATLEFSMKVQGTYHEVAMFIDSVGKLDRIVNVTNLSMRSPKEENQKIIVASSMDVKTFRFVSDAERKARKAAQKKKKKKKRRKK